MKEINKKNYGGSLFLLKNNGETLCDEILWKMEGIPNRYLGTYIFSIRCRKIQGKYLGFSDMHSYFLYYRDF